MKCPSCGADNANNNQVCQYCGCYLAQSQPTSSPQQTEPPQTHPTVVVNSFPVTTIGGPPLAPTSKCNKMVALVLCIFLGVFGAHHFYTGKIGMGILYLLTGGLFCIGWIIDIAKISSGNYSDKNGTLLT